MSRLAAPQSQLRGLEHFLRGFGGPVFAEARPGGGGGERGGLGSKQGHGKMLVFCFFFAFEKSTVKRRCARGLVGIVTDSTGNLDDHDKDSA